jgi:hypothetical protein
MARSRFYSPGDKGFERELGKRLAYWDDLRNDKSRKKD